MTLLRKMAEKVRGLFGNRANDPEFDVEMQEHMRLLAERYMRQGMAPESAAIAARRNQTHEIAEQAVTGARLLAPRSVTNHLPAALRAVAALQLRNQAEKTGGSELESGISKIGSPHWTHLELLQRKSPGARTRKSSLLTKVRKRNRAVRPSWAPRQDRARTLTGPDAFSLILGHRRVQ